MSSFTEASFEQVFNADGKPLTIKGRVVWRVTEGFYWELGYLGSGIKIYVPKGYMTDGASIPYLFRLLIPKTIITKAFLSSCVHDMLRFDQRFTLDETNAVFWLCMEAEKTNKFWREIFFQCVRLNSNRY